MADKKTPLVTNPAAPEIFADRTTSVSMRGNVARITLASERTTGDPRAPEAIISGHLAMSLRGFLQLFGQMQSVVRQMEASGLLKQTAKPDARPAAARGKAASKPKTASTGGRGKSKKT
ncbi:MAG: hypothetical protein WD075_10325 [Rhodospirillales bacterium]